MVATSDGAPSATTVSFTIALMKQLPTTTLLSLDVKLNVFWVVLLPPPAPPPTDAPGVGLTLPVPEPEPEPVGPRGKIRTAALGFDGGPVKSPVVNSMVGVRSPTPPPPPSALTTGTGASEAPSSSHSLAAASIRIVRSRCGRTKGGYKKDENNRTQ